MTDLEKIEDQLNLALNEIKTTLTVEQGELIHDYVFEAQRLVKKLILPDVINLACNYEPDDTTAMNCKHCGNPKWTH